MSLQEPHCHAMSSQDHGPWPIPFGSPLDEIDQDKDVKRLERLVNLLKPTPRRSSE